jgi:starvation-inducible DNA-binding protein
MEILADLLKKTLAETFSLYLKAHNYHWNVEGENFIQYHEYLGDLYEEIFNSIDDIAEKIRIIGSYAPGSLSRFKELSEIEDELMIRTSKEMFTTLLRDNQILLNTLNETLKRALEVNKQGLADFLAGRIDVHDKHAWMLRSFLVNG